VTARPNVLLFTPDQLRADCLGAFGNDVVQTPAIDALPPRVATRAWSPISSAPFGSSPHRD